MSALPRVLARFGELLPLFADDVSLPLAELSRRLAVLVGPLLSPRELGQGEPEGFEGLARRGPYDRLLLSEWLLADEAPDEFLRRAATGEHAFLSLARRAEVGTRRSVVLLDSGPLQIGGPRVAQLAVLLLLGARAQGARVRFAFGSLEDETRTLHELDEQGIRAFLAFRTPNEPTVGDTAGWLDALAPLGRDDDVWMVGSPALIGWTGGAKLFCLDEVVSPSVRAVTAFVVDRHGKRSRELVLELPPPKVCAELLRRPWRSALPKGGPAIPDLDPRGGVVFSPSGTRVLARRQDGRVVALPVPASPRAGFGRPRETFVPEMDRGLVPVAAGWRKKHTLVVTAGDGRLVLGGALFAGSGIHRVELPLPRALADRTPEDPLGRLFVGHVGPGRDPILFIEDRRRDSARSALLCATLDDATSVLVRPLTSGRLLDVTCRDDRVGAAVFGAGKVDLWLWAPSFKSAVFRSYPIQGDTAEAAFWRQAGEYPFGVFVLRHQGGVIVTGGQGRPHVEHVPPELRVLGVIQVPCEPLVATYVVTQGQARDRLGLMGAGDDLRVIDLSRTPPASDVAVSTRHPVAAFIDDQGRVVIHRLSDDVRLVEGSPR